MTRLPDYRKNSLLGMQDMLRSLKQQQNRSQFSPRILASDGDGGMTRDEAIGNDALSGALVPWAGVAVADTFGLTVAWATVATLTVPVPAGFTRALVVNVSAQAYAKNTTATPDYLYTRPYINADSAPIGASGWTIPSPAIGPDAYGATVAPGTSSLINLNGSFTVNLDVSTSFAAWAASTGNFANLFISLLFLR